MTKIARRLVGFMEKLIQSDSRESSKRAIALFITLLIGVIVIMYTNSQNILLVLGELIAFVTALLYIATNGKLPNLPKFFKKDENDEPKA